MIAAVRGVAFVALVVSPSVAFMPRKSVVSQHRSQLHRQQQGSHHRRIEMRSGMKCDSACLGQNMAAPLFNTLGSFIPQQFKEDNAELFAYFDAHPAATSALFLGCSLIFFLTLVNAISKPDPDAPKISTKEELAAYLTRPPQDYTGDEAFNVFLVVFHGYCFYDAFNRGDFEGFSVFAFLPQLAVCVLIQIFSKLRGDARGVVIAKKPPAWSTYAEGKRTGLDKLKPRVAFRNKDAFNV